MQAVAYRENIVPIRAKSIFLLQKLELRKSDSNHFKKVFAKWKFADVCRFAADSLYGRQRFGFTAWGLRAESDTPFAAPRLRADRSTATLRFARNKGGRMICRRMFIASIRSVM